jgi:putative endonuclease
MKFANRETGTRGEEYAYQYLLKHGFEPITRNFSTRFGEIDLIMKDKDILVFIEVKTKKGVDFGTPEEMFTQNKLRRVHNMAMVYLRGIEVPCRIDMVAILLNPDNTLQSLKHYPNVT